MALVECSECGAKISDLASSCPHCGCPASSRRRRGMIHFMWQGQRGGSLRKTKIIVDRIERATVRCGDSFSVEVNAGKHEIDLYQGSRKLLHTVVAVCGVENDAYVVFKETMGFSHAKLKLVEDTTVFADNINNAPHCPACGSTRVKKIAYAKRNLSIGAWGLRSNLINKTYECENCKYTW